MSARIGVPGLIGVLVFASAVVLVPTAAGALIVPQQGELTASDGAANDIFGSAVAIAGSTAVVGAADHNSGRGAVYIFKKSGSSWAQVAEITASDGRPGDEFGASVAISGPTVIVGSLFANSGAGAAYVFTGALNFWGQIAKLTAADGVPGDSFGSSVSVSGTRAIVGAFGHGGFSKGAAYVFTGSSGWAQVAELTADDAADGDAFGYSVSISGSTALVGAYGGNSDVGAAYTFSRKAYSTVWHQSAKITPSDGATGDEFGFSVALSGTTAIIGALHGNSYTGAAYVFTKSMAAWTQATKFTASDGAVNDEFGFSVSIASGRAIVGARSHNSQRGAAYTYTKTLTGWLPGAELTASDGAANDQFGTSVSLSGSSGAIAGARNHNSNTGAAYAYDVVSQSAEVTASDGASFDHFGEAVSVSGTSAIVGAKAHGTTGAAYVYNRSSSGWAQHAELTASDGVAGDEFGYSVAMTSTVAVVGAPYRGSVRGAAYVFTKTLGVWSQTAVLTASDGVANDEFGYSVAISGGAVILIGANGQNAGQGAAYVFNRSSSGWAQRAELTASDGVAGDEFGISVSISGRSAIVGAEAHASHAGAAYVFNMTTSNTWVQDAQLVASDGVADDEFGLSVAISGTTAIVGAHGHSSHAGAAYVFSKTLSGWAQDAELTASDGASFEEFGYAVAISGTTALAGAPFRTGPLGNGATYVFTQTLGGWGQTAVLTAPDGAAGDAFGLAVAISNKTSIVGAPWHSSYTGAAYSSAL